MELSGERVAEVLAEAAEAEKSELEKKEDEDEKKKEDEDEKKEEDEGEKKGEKPSAAPKVKAKAKAKAKAPSLKRPAASTVKTVKKQKPDEEKEKKEKKEKVDENEDEEEKDEEAAPSKGKAGKAKAKAKNEKNDKADEKKEKNRKDEKKENKEKKDDKKENKDKKDDKKEKKDKDKKSKGAADLEKAQALVEIEDEEEEENEGPKEGETVKRDSKKAWYFHRHFAQLPDSVQNLFNSKDVSRTQKSALVNDCVVKTAAGSWALQPDNPTVSALSAFPLISLVKFSFFFTNFICFHFTQACQRDSEGPHGCKVGRRAEPSRGFEVRWHCSSHRVARFFYKFDFNVNFFLAVFSQNWIDLLKHMRQGREYYAWKEISMTKEVGTNESLTMQRQQVVLEKKEDVDTMDNMFANFNPMFGGGSSLISDVNMGQSSSQRSGFLIFFLLIFFIYLSGPKKTPFQQACWLWSCQVPLPLLLLLRLVGSTCRSLAPAMVPSSWTMPLHWKYWRLWNGLARRKKAVPWAIYIYIFLRCFSFAHFSAFFALFFHSHFSISSVYYSFLKFSLFFRGKKALQSDASGSAATQLKNSLKSKLSVLLDQQRQLDEIRLTGSHNGMKEVKDLLSATAKALCDTQEVIRALTAMG